MVGLDTIRASNASLKSLGPGLVGVFVGGTSGIGESTLRAFAKHTLSPKIYLVGRSEEAATKITSDIKGFNSEANVSFVKCDATLLRNVDGACKEIQAKEDKINLLVLSSGYLTLKGREESSEGLDRKFALNYYSRIRFISNLSPQLTSASSSRAASSSLSRVLTILGAGNEGSIHDSDLSLRHNFSLRSCASHSIVMTDFAFEHLAKTYPGTGFVHSSPGGVDTNAAKRMGGVTGKLLGWVAASGIARPWMTELGESGERHLFEGTSGRYRGREERVQERGIEGEGKEEAETGFGEEKGSGAYPLGSDCERLCKDSLLKEMRDRGVREKVWEHTVEVFRRIDEGGRYEGS